MNVRPPPQWSLQWFSGTQSPVSTSNQGRCLQGPHSKSQRRGKRERLGPVLAADSSAVPVFRVRDKLRRTFLHLQGLYYVVSIRRGQLQRLHNLHYSALRYPSQPALPAGGPVLHLHNSSSCKFCKSLQALPVQTDGPGLARSHVSLDTLFEVPDSICRCRLCRLSRDGAPISVFITSHAHPRNILGTSFDTLPSILTCSSASGQREPSPIAMCSAASPCGAAASNHGQNVVLALMEGAHRLGHSSVTSNDASAM